MAKPVDRCQCVFKTPGRRRAARCTRGAVTTTGAGERACAECATRMGWPVEEDYDRADRDAAGER